MELAELKTLVATLRSLGVTKYRVGDVELELGSEPRAELPADVTRLGFGGAGVIPAGGAKPERSAQLQKLLDRIDPAYSDDSLFEIR